MPLLRLAGCAFIVVVQAMLAACAPRTGGAGPPVSPPISQAPVSPPTDVPARPAPSPEVVQPQTVADECRVVPGSTAADVAEAIAAVGLTERIEVAHAPRPTNDSERLLFRQLYETLVRADCMGRVVPGLAASWQLDADGQTWLVTLRENARFSDGTPVTAAHVRAGWTNSNDGSLRPEVTRLVDSVTGTGDRTLAIRLRHHRIDVPLPLAHPDLAIAKSVAGVAWPLGTRSGLSFSNGPGYVAEGRTSPVTITRGSAETMRFLVAPGDARDLLDRTVDLLLTRNPAALEYAATLPSFQSFPLDWHRTYVLLTPGRARGLPGLSDNQRDVLADDAVRGEARGARGPFWWQMSSECRGLASAATVPVAAPGQRPAGQLAPRIVFDANDEVARDLAERFVGLVRAGGPGAIPFLDVLLPDRPRRTYQRATGLTGDDLARAQRMGRDAGYVVALDSRPLDACRELQVLVDAASWVDPDTIVPLVETRLHAVIRRGRGGVTAEWDGGLLIAPGEPARSIATNGAR